MVEEGVKEVCNRGCGGQMRVRVTHSHSVRKQTSNMQHMYT